MRDKKRGKVVGRCGLNASGSVAGAYEQCNETSGSIKHEFLEWLCDY
jgi:hypothetical protein